MDSERILAFLQGWDGVAVLATIVATEGHSYRKAGASMLFYGEEGAGRLGSISPGCLESDLQLRVDGVWSEGAPEVVDYDMLRGDDVSWGEAVGCGGKISVLLEPVKGELRDTLLEAAACAARGERATLLRRRGAAERRYELLRGYDAAPDASAFAVVFEPSPRLVLFGAGLDAVPIAAAAERVGFRAAVVDWREHPAVRDRFPNADIVVGAPEDAAMMLGLNERDYIVVCSHRFERDRRFIRAALQAKPRYLGVVGSVSRVRALFDGEEPPAFVRAPIGLAIGADGPEEIAVSIAAEMIRIRRMRAAAAPQTGGMHGEDGGHLFGGGSKQEDGTSEAAHGAVGG